MKKIAGILTLFTVSFLTFSISALSSNAMADNAASYLGLAWTGNVYKVTAGYEDGLSYSLRFKNEPGLKSLTVYFEHSNGIDYKSSSASLQKLINIPNEEIWSVILIFPENAPIGVWRGKALAEFRTNVSLTIPLFDIEVLKKPQSGVLTFEQENKLSTFLSNYKVKKIPNAQAGLNAISLSLNRTESYINKLNEFRSIEEFKVSKIEISNYAENILLNAEDTLKSYTDELEADKNFWTLNVVGWTSESLSKVSDEYRTILTKYGEVANELIPKTRILKALVTTTESRLLTARAEEESKAKQEAEAKTAAELKAKQAAEAKAAQSKNKKTTITCVKGKLTKKVTAINPKCPKGYKRK